MRQFISFIKKEFLYIFRDTWTMIILLVLPVMMLILFGFGISTEIKNTRVAVYDCCCHSPRKRDRLKEDCRASTK